MCGNRRRVEQASQLAVISDQWFETAAEASGGAVIEQKNPSSPVARLYPRPLPRPSLLVHLLLSCSVSGLHVQLWNDSACQLPRTAFARSAPGAAHQTAPTGAPCSGYCRPASAEQLLAVDPPRRDDSRARICVCNQHLRCGLSSVQPLICRHKGWHSCLAALYLELSIVQNNQCLEHKRKNRRTR